MHGTTVDILELHHALCTAVVVSLCLFPGAHELGAFIGATIGLQQLGDNPRKGPFSQILQEQSVVTCSSQGLSTQV